MLTASRRAQVARFQNKGTGLLSVANGVLADTLGGLVGGEHDVRRVEGQVVELRVGRQVALALLVLRGDPSDRTGNNTSL